MFLRNGLIIFQCAVTLSVGSASRAELTDEQQKLWNDAAEILTRSCLKCHAGNSPKSQLDLSTRDGILAGGEQGGPAYDTDDPNNSNLIQAIRYDGLEMPPNRQLPVNDIRILEQWVQQGMPWPRDHRQLESAEATGPPEVNEETKGFWSFQPLTEPLVPDSNWGFNEIDNFIASRLAENGLEPSPASDAQSLVRRMHYNVTGLPPEPEAAERWTARLHQNDGTVNQAALEELIETLLASPHYGEQWGRHWLDLVRYAETNSYERDGAKPYVWRYRDYVIRAFNSDKPYDQFITEQLAGDELENCTSESVIATGYYRLGRWDDEPVDHALAFYDDLDDIIGTTFQTMLGLTVNCARCHDHKIDPIPQRDYYRLLGFFRNIRRYGIRSDKTVRDASVREVDLPEEASLLDQEYIAHDEKISNVKRLIDEFEQTVIPLLTEPQKEDFEFVTSRLPIVNSLLDSGLTKEQITEYQRLDKQLKTLQENGPSGRAKVLCITEDMETIHTTHVLTRGNPHAPGEEVLPGFPSVLSPPNINMPEIPEGAKTTGRRKVLAAWITSPQNPLTARVMVNRIWQYHFGRGIVRSSSDFGFQGTPPTHPLLLDWLASQFVTSGWSVKHMHRLIMSSATFQMSSSARQHALNQDPVNDLFWRFNMRRMSAEEIRDSILWAAGNLNTKKMFGPSIYTDIPDEVKAGQSQPGRGWETSSPEDQNRRSIYIHVKRSLVDPLLVSFDFADTDQACPVRFVTTQPTQALGLLNSKFMQQQAAAFADSLRKQQSSIDQVRQGLTLVTQRPPSEDEIRKGLILIEQLQSKEGLTSDQALQYFCLLALNLNEFIYLD
ncbi:MAG: PSD1 and planctomycete cytochrome C domain-containing protein [Fuerstiella sp.]|nr:PSD1 and planctomycete cytochrome C domain-containing protein [Fuerstiella sp.]